MISEKSLNPPTGVLPFNMFRTFSPSSGTPANGPTCEINQTQDEWVLKINVPTFVDSSDIQAELRYGVLTVRLHSEV